MTRRRDVARLVGTLLTGLLLAATLSGCGLVGDQVRTPPPAVQTTPKAVKSPAPGGAVPDQVAAPRSAVLATAAAGSAQPQPSVALTPGPRAMTVYSVTNPNSAALDVLHVITDPVGFRHTFSARVPPGATVEFHLRDVVAVPSPFNGTLTLHADKPFTAAVIAYDYP
ncbi:MAG: hypothetical protein ACYC4L_03200 [Chloroflexota bacterium]